MPKHKYQTQNIAGKTGFGGIHKQRNKSELETIMEKVKEEEIAMSHSNIPKVDVEESYSFSLRNFNNKNL